MTGEPLLQAAIVRRFGSAARIENLEVATLGGSSRTLLFDLVDGSARRRLASRQETYVAADSPFLTPGDQFRAIAVAFRHDLPVPQPIFAFEPADGLGQGFVTAFVAGETMPKRIQADSEAHDRGDALAHQLGRLLARLHAIPVAEMGFLAERPDSRDPLRAQRDRYDRYGQTRPALEYGFRWLERNRPATGAPAILHGDFRIGNLMIRDGDVAALLDWECAHLGGTAEDLGWLSARAWRFGRPDLPVAGLAGYAPLLAGYAAAGGVPPDADAIRWWQVFATVRWAVLNLMQADAHVRGDRRGLVYAACGRNTALVEYDLLMMLTGRTR